MAYLPVGIKRLVSLLLSSLSHSTYPFQTPFSSPAINSQTMPALQSGKVLVSGANGYIAVWVVKKLLEDGFAVRGTVRSEKSIPYLQQLFSSYGDKVEFVIVPDITLVRILLFTSLSFCPRVNIAGLIYLSPTAWRI